MSTSTVQPTGFGDLLRYWRGQRRLSQLDLSLICSVSQRHLSFLESGRASPSRQMVLQLSEGLDLPLRERNQLLSASGFAAAYSWRKLDGHDMQPVRQALDLLLTHHLPYPALVVDAQWNLVSANAALPALLSLAGDMNQMWQAVCPNAALNVLKLCFHPQGLRPYIANFETFASHVINRNFREAATDPQIQPLLEEILSYPDMPDRWQFPDFSQPSGPLVTMDLAMDDHAISLFSTITTFGTAQDVTASELRVESFFPADASTATLLRGLLDDSDHTEV